MFYLCFIGPTVEKTDQEGQSLLRPAATSLVLALLVQFRDCCFARPAFRLSHCFEVPATLCSLGLRRFGVLPRPSRLCLLLKAVPPVLTWFLFRSGFTCVIQELASSQKCGFRLWIPLSLHCGDWFFSLFANGFYQNMLKFQRLIFRILFQSHPLSLPF